MGPLTLFDSEWPKLYGVFAVLNAKGLNRTHVHFKSSISWEKACMRMVSLRSDCPSEQIDRAMVY